MKKKKFGRIYAASFALAFFANSLYYPVLEYNYRKTRNEILESSQGFKLSSFLEENSYGKQGYNLYKIITSKQFNNYKNQCRLKIDIIPFAIERLVEEGRPDEIEELLRLMYDASVNSQQKIEVAFYSLRIIDAMNVRREKERAEKKGEIEKILNNHQSIANSTDR